MILQADIALLPVALIVPITSCFLVMYLARALKSLKPWRRSDLLGVLIASCLILAGLTLAVLLDAPVILRLLLGVVITSAGFSILSLVKTGGRRPFEFASYLAIIAAAALIVASVATALSGESQPVAHTRSGVVTALAGVRPKMAGGFGPDRAKVLRCRQPDNCPGPHYVVMDSFYNTPRVRDERPFFSVGVPDHPHAPVQDSLVVGNHSPVVATLRAYIDNDTYQELSGGKDSAALDTHLRLALPSGPVYSVFPTMYLFARNAHPKLIWDTIHVMSRWPVRLSIIPGSVKMERRKAADGPVISTRPTGDPTQGTGLALGNWPADFPYSGYVTMKLSVTPLKEPVRDPAATWGTLNTVYATPASNGLLKEPVIDGSVGEQFRCTATRCDGPPYPKLNAYINQPLLGDEADFLRGSVAGEVENLGHATFRSVVQAKAGDSIVVHALISNGADPSAIGAPPPRELFARRLEGRIQVPTNSGRELRLVAKFRTANGLPRLITDTLPIRSEEDIRLTVRRPSLAALLQAAGDRFLPKGFIHLEGAPFRYHRWRNVAPGLAPSFSRVLLISFTIQVRAGNER